MCTSAYTDVHVGKCILFVYLVSLLACCMLMCLGIPVNLLKSIIFVPLHVSMCVHTCAGV